MDKVTYLQLLRAARRVAKRQHEAEDLLQTVLLAAVNAGRTDMSVTANRSWLIGALQKRAMFDARSAARRQRREASYLTTRPQPDKLQILPRHFTDQLPAALRTTALLALTGHTRKEIAWLLRISDAAFRQRIKQIRRRWVQLEGDSFAEIPGLDGELEFGRLRKSMLKSVKQKGSILATHDPDGHLFLICTNNCSQNYKARQQAE